MDWTKIDIADIAKVAIIGVGGWAANIVRKKAWPFIKSLVKFGNVVERQDNLEKQFKIKQSRNRAILHIDKHPIFITDNKGEVTYVNPAWVEMTGMDERDALGKGYLQAIPDEDIDSMEAKSERMIKHPSSLYDEVVFIHVRTKQIIKTMCRSEPVYQDESHKETIGRLYIIETI